MLERESINITDFPEFGIVTFSFFLHFVWEFIQAPTYAGMIELNHWDGIKLCTSATFGDVGFALTAYWLTSVMARSRHWIFDTSASHWQLLLFLAVGLGLTIGFEYYYTNISLRWTYSDLMPLVPPFGTGLSPLLQWIVVPLLVVWFTRRMKRARPN